MFLRQLTWFHCSRLDIFHNSMDLYPHMTFKIGF